MKYGANSKGRKENIMKIFMSPLQQVLDIQ